MFIADDATAANVLAVRLKGDLILELAERRHVTANDRLGLVAMSLYNNNSNENLLIVSSENISFAGKR